jgi:ABC-type bacteriocin/lantibiotic exporter with double-glycine peptidase domain
MKKYIIALLLFVPISVFCQVRTAGNPNMRCILQEKSNWCWAACIQMVLNNSGIPVSQSQIVQYVYGDLRNRDADQQQMANSLRGWGIDYSGRRRLIYCQEGISGAPEIIQTLSQGWPLIVGIRNRSGSGNHAIVVSAVDYYFDVYNNQPAIAAVYIQDPLYGDSYRATLQEFLNVSDGMCLKVWAQ